VDGPRAVATGEWLGHGSRGTVCGSRFTVHGARCTGHGARGTVCGVRCAVCGVRCAVCGVRCAVYGVRCTVYGVRCTVYGVRCTGAGRGARGAVHLVHRVGDCRPHRLAQRSGTAMVMARFWHPSRVRLRCAGDRGSHPIIGLAALGWMRPTAMFFHPVGMGRAGDSARVIGHWSLVVGRRLPTADSRLPTTDYRLPTTDYRLLTTDL
jgi:hypothetical protein